MPAARTFAVSSRTPGSSRCRARFLDAHMAAPSIVLRVGENEVTIGAGVVAIKAKKLVMDDEAIEGDPSLVMLYGELLSAARSELLDAAHARFDEAEGKT